MEDVPLKKGNVLTLVKKEKLRYINKKGMIIMTYISVKCPVCGSENVSKNGTTKSGKQ